jgi:hypothetical protein
MRIGLQHEGAHGGVRCISVMEGDRRTRLKIATNQTSKLANDINGEGLPEQWSTRANSGSGRTDRSDIRARR